MTVRLKVQYGKYPPNTNLTTGADEEARLLREGLADTNTSAGAAYVAPSLIERSGPPSVVTTDGVDALVADGRVLSLVSGAGTPILNAATAGQDSGWITYYPGMRLAYALDSGSTATTFSVDISADGSTSLGQAFTGTWASTTAEISPPIWLSNPAARFIRFNVLTGGPLSVVRF
jgi:hypothetical protein